MPGGVSSPARAFQHVQSPPLVAKSGLEGKIFDVDGNSYIDLCMGWGALILGHNSPIVTQALIEQLKNGVSFGVLSDIEEAFASKIVRLCPHVEMVRFLSTGTEATMSAIRLCRGASARAKILKFSGQYHGHSDALLVQGGSALAMVNAKATSEGVLQSSIDDTLVLPFNDKSSLEELFALRGEEIAAVIVEPISGNMGVVPPEKGFLESLRVLTRRYGALLIFDEVITGFRVGIQGASGLFGIDPDLVCYGKILGGGLPASLVGGKKELMSHFAPTGKVYQAGTFSANPLVMRAGFATIEALETPGVYEILEKKAKKMALPITAALEGKNACLQRVGSMMSLFFGTKKVLSKETIPEEHPRVFAEFFRFLFQKGIFLPPSPYESWFLSLAHSDEEIEYITSSILTFLEERL